MVGGRLCCLCCFFTYSAVLLLGVCLHDVEASNCPRIIHKQVGDTVELPSCLPTEGVTSVVWKFGDKTVADMEQSLNTQSTDRIYLNNTTCSLTVRRLIAQDSGNYSFLSEAKDVQRDTVIITLHVHEPITTPVLTANTTSHAFNGSCTVFLWCTSDGQVNYNWTVKDRTHRGSSTQHYTIRPQDGETTFTCTVWNVVSEQSASTTVTCSNDTSDPTKPEPENFVLFLSVAAGAGLTIIIVVTIIIWVCLHTQRQSEGSDANDLTVYADISDYASEDRTSANMKPCSVYETIDNRVNAATSGPQTVYDKIQFNHMRNASGSP
ncbi:T-lymphocyte surface antigen Ly-9 [Seriola aureovittata]|uniref:T-lymphocyte surface antigen Ly-9 n=1 Tax=Seriola aureovittata TaxID=2871759 RepID=UPI0024BE0995|nr:T-lymphocyte surface antigen Ly-9 [Seriola aureovittata]XP_056225946.1 T-lymphocyte surface antigen Ly-9 [Seriola aureovittata]